MDRDKFGRFLSGGSIGKRHWAWKGNKVGYQGVHGWLRRNLKKIKCSECSSTENLDFANISGKYTRRFSDWKVLCKKHHHIFDDVYRKMMETRKKNGSRFAKGNSPKYKCKECGVEAFGHPLSGLCAKHFHSAFREKHRVRLKEYKRKWYIEHKSKRTIRT